MLKKLMRVCEEEFRRAVDAVVAVHDYVRELDEQVLRSLGVILRGPRDSKLFPSGNPAPEMVRCRP